jgi:HEAT repeat protein
MGDQGIEYDVFLSYSSKDKEVVHALANRLRGDGVRVWLDDWVIQPGDAIGMAIARGLETSRTLVMCMSPAYFESEWGKLEHHSILFRDPINAQRRFLPVLIKDCRPPDIIAHFAYVDWRTTSDAAYKKLVTSCRSHESRVVLGDDTAKGIIANFGYIACREDESSHPEPELISTYLQNVSTFPDFERWRTRYAELHVEVSEIKVRFFKDADEKDEGIETPLVDAVRSRDRCLLLGAPGSGKSTSLELLMYLVSQDARSQLHAKGAFSIPVYVPLSHYLGEKTLVTLVRSSLQRQGAVFKDSDSAEKFMRTTNMLVLLDGLNEVAGKHRADAVVALKVLFKNHPQHRYIVTCRTEDYFGQLRDDDKPIDMLVIQPLGLDQVQAYLREHLSEGVGESLWHSLPERLQDLARQPMMLRMLHEIGKSGKPIENTADVFSTYVEHAFEREAGKGDRALTIPGNVKAESLVALAFKMHRKHALQFDEEEVRKQLVGVLTKRKESFNWRDVLGEIRLNGFLSCDSFRYRFPHQLFQEFFAAVAFKRRLNDLSRDDWLSYVRDEWWSETFIMLAGLVEDADAFVLRVAEDNPILASRCIRGGRETTIDTKTAIAEKIAPLLEATTSGRMWRTEDYALRWIVSLGSPAIPALKIACTNRDGFVRSNALRGLFEIDEGIGRDHALEMLGDTSAYVRYSAAEFLSSKAFNIKAFNIEEKLISRLEDGDAGARTAAAAALRRLGLVPLPVIQRALRDKDPSVRAASVDLLPNHAFSTEVANCYRIATTDKQWRVRIKAVRCLGAIQEPRSIEFLAEVLASETESSVIYACIRAIGDRKHDKVRTAILQATNHVNDLATIEVLSTSLLRYGAGVKDACLRALITGGISTRYCAARVLGSLRCQEAATILISLLSHSNEHIVGVASWALGEIRTPSAISHLEAARKSAGNRRWASNVPLQETIDEAIAAIRRGS